jgi:hypothetical protein
MNYLAYVLPEKLVSSFKGYSTTRILEGKL